MNFELYNFSTTENHNLLLTAKDYNKVLAMNLASEILVSGEGEVLVRCYVDDNSKYRNGLAIIDREVQVYALNGELIGEGDKAGMVVLMAAIQHDWSLDSLNLPKSVFEKMDEKILETAKEELLNSNSIFSRLITKLKKWTKSEHQLQSLVQGTFLLSFYLQSNLAEAASACLIKSTPTANDLVQFFLAHDEASMGLAAGIIAALAYASGKKSHLEQLRIQRSQFSMQQNATLKESFRHIMKELQAHHLVWDEMTRMSYEDVVKKDDELKGTIWSLLSVLNDVVFYHRKAKENIADPENNWHNTFLYLFGHKLFITAFHKHKHSLSKDMCLYVNRCLSYINNRANPIARMTKNPPVPTLDVHKTSEK